MDSTTFEGEFATRRRSSVHRPGRLVGRLVGRLAGHPADRPVGHQLIDRLADYDPALAASRLVLRLVDPDFFLYRLPLLFLPCLK